MGFSDGELEAELEGDITLPVGGLINAYKKAQRDPLVRQCVLYMIFILNFCIVMTLVRPVHTTFEIQNAIYSQLATEAMSPDTVHFEKTFYDIANWGDFWLWTTTVLQGTAYHCCYPSGKSFLATYGNMNDRRIAQYNRLMTPIRFRQVRTKTNEGCSTPKQNHEMSRPCWGDYGENTVNKDASPWTPDGDKKSTYMTGLSNFVGDEDDGFLYGTEGHVVDLPLDKTKAAERIEWMMRERWTDEGTRAISIDVNTYNPNFDMATVMRFKIDIVGGGMFFPKVETMSARLNPYSNTTDYMRLLCEVIFAGMTVYYLWGEMQELKSSGLKEYLSSFWNIVELGNLSVFIIIMYKWTEYVGYDKSAFRRRDWSEFHDLYTPAALFNYSAHLGAANVVWAFLKVFKYLQLNSRFLLIWDVLGHSMTYILPFSVIIILIVFAFCFSGVWLFGQRIEAFHTWTLAQSYLLRSCIDGFEYEPMKDAQPSAAPLWAFGWTFMSTLILLNMFIAILSDSYVFVRERTQKQDAIEAEFPMPSWKVFFRSKLFCIPAKSIAEEEELLDLKHMNRELTETFEQVNAERLFRMLLHKVGGDDDSVTVEDMTSFFSKEDGEDEAVVLKAREWMEKMAKVAGLSLKKETKEVTTLDEIAKLRDRIGELEIELKQIHEAMATGIPAHLGLPLWRDNAYDYINPRDREMDRIALMG
eukprot:gnl/MRDRNA2_/MRDRNA2_94304_c0_seq1.p1 gnl/MRDRNA2_/MRDRNA2_94304_c0~~gnl/MRDRNA2_/MRDRNA2_94304_c0_seq1.p1  ORF type:complete len:699 (+),score=125.40 gnl/MRDRNA2_/MRDRNA2_94304_c0_seq1:149-2245(+)